MHRTETEQKLAFRRRRQLDSLYSQAQLALLASAVCGTILAAIMFSVTPRGNLLHWAGVMIAVAVVRYCVIHGFYRRQAQDTHIDRWRYAFVGTLFASGAAWGTASYFIAPSAQVNDQAIVVIFICGFVAASVAAFSVDRLAFGAFTAPALGIPVINLALFSDATGQTLAFVLTIFGVFLLCNALRSNKAHKKDFDTQYEKQELAAKLQIEKKKITELADDLEVRVKMRTDELTLINRQLSERIAETHEAEKEVKIQETRFLEVFDQAPIGMLVVHTDSGRVIRANSAICAFLGYDAADLSGMLAEKLLCPSERTVKQGGAIFEHDGVIERRYLHRRGFVVWGRTSTGMLADNGLRDTHFVIQIEDLSELKRARDALSERGDSLEVAFQAAPVGMAVIDGSGRIVNGNTCMQSILNLTGTIEGRSLTSILNARNDDNNSDILARLFTGELDSIEFEHRLFGTGETGKLVVVRITRVKGHSDSRPFAVVHIRYASSASISPRPIEQREDTKLIALHATA